MKFFKDLRYLFKNLFHDERIPSRDKKTLIILAALIISPIDFVPDWIGFFGQVDDLIMFSLIMDYLFRVLDSRVLLSHWPWGMKSYARLRNMARAINFFAPNLIIKRIWSYVGDPY